MTETAVENGQDTAHKAAKPVPAQREHGIDRLREEECYFLTGLIGECLREAEHLVKKVHSKALSRTIDHDGSKGTRPLDRDEAKAILDGAYECASLALAYIYSASEHLNSAAEPLF